MNGDKCVHWSFLSNTGHLISISNGALSAANTEIVYNRVGTFNGRPVGVALTISNLVPTEASEQKATVTIKDTISKGLRYVEGSAKVGNTSINPTVTKNSDGTTTLVWTKEVNAGVNEELTYTVLVTGGVDKVNNKATVKYNDDPEIQLPELSNPLIPESIINIPDTGSTIAIIGVVASIAMVASDGYLVYKKYKK